VILHKNAESIILLNLSGNPMIEIPLDFIQSCISLRELRLSNMAIKKVPTSIRHTPTLHRLDLSSNRIADLDEAALDRVPGLATLKVQNNRMEKLPWYFPRLRALKSLNISNNKFRHLPAVVCEMVSLVDLDVSFNMLSELPEEIGQLVNLENLVIVGNQITKFPDECRQLVSLELLDCRRNLISDLAVVCMLPKLQFLKADHNAVHALDLSFGPCLNTLDASHNDITQLTVTPRNPAFIPTSFTSLDISHAKLSSLSELVLSHLPSLTTLKVDHNSIRYIPDSLGGLSMLTVFTCSDNELSALPASIGMLQRLEILDAHGNSLEELPVSIWNCASLYQINVTSNLLGVWHDPPLVTVQAPSGTSSPDRDFGGGQALTDRKTSAASSLGSSRVLPPLAHSLERLYLGENKITDDQLHPLAILKELRVLNLSFNSIQDLPPAFFRNLTKLEEFYLSGNKLSTFPTEDLYRLTRLSTLFLNGNRLQTLPQEFRAIQSLTILDVGSNVLKYNINNWEFDWNW
jgi:adenylate cyclase